MAHNNIEDITSGTIYSKIQGALVERAQVLGVHKDLYGIPHVRFTLEMKRGQDVPTIVQRTLALASFRDRYREQPT